MPPPLRRNRDFTLLWSGLAVSTLGTQISSVAYPLVVLALTHSRPTRGIVGFARMLPYLVVQLPGRRETDLHAAAARRLSVVLVLDEPVPDMPHRCVDVLTQGPSGPAAHTETTLRAVVARAEADLLDPPKAPLPAPVGRR